MAILQGILISFGMIALGAYSIYLSQKTAQATEIQKRMEKILIEIRDIIRDRGQ